MRQQKIFSLLLVVMTLLIIGLSTGIAYGMDTDDIFKVHEDVRVSPDQGNFNIVFTGRPTFTGEGTANYKYINSRNVVMDIKGLKSAGDALTATFNINNNSRDMGAILSETISNSNTEYFKVTVTFSNNTIKSRNGKETISIKVELLKTPVIKEEKANISIKIIAKPYYNN